MLYEVRMRGGHPSRGGAFAIALVALMLLPAGAMSGAPDRPEKGTVVPDVAGLKGPGAAASLTSSLTSSVPHESSSTFEFTGRTPFDLTIPVRKGSDLDSVTLAITSVPDAPPRDLTATVPDEPLVWSFTGRFGALDQFSNGKKSEPLVFGGPGTQTRELHLPDGFYSTASMSLATKVASGPYRYSLSMIGEEAWNRSDTTSPFSPPSPLPPISLGIGQVITGDVNGDGKNDLVAGDWASNLVHLRSRANGTFELVQVLAHNTSGWPANGLALVDLDADLDLDLLFGSSNGRVQTMTNTNGDFGSPAFLTYVSDSTRSWRFGDLDKNGKQDAIAISEYYDRLYIQWNPNGSQTTQPQMINVNGSSTSALELFDFDSDTYPDIVVGDRAGCPSIYLNDQSGGFAPRMALPCIDQPIGALAVGALDSNPDVDLVVGATYDRAYVMFNVHPGPPTSVLNRTYSYGRTSDALISDVDGDALNDIVLGTAYGYVPWLKGTGAGNVSKSRSFGGAGSDVRDLVRADGDLDGRLDLVAASDQGMFLFSNSKSGFKESVWFLDEVRAAMAKVNPTKNSEGNFIRKVPLDLTSGFAGTLDAGPLDLRYVYTAVVNATAAVGSYASKNPPNFTGMVNVPLTIDAAEPGDVSATFTLKYLRSPPFQVRQFPTPAARVPEDTVVRGAVDLEYYFGDDRDDGRLAFTMQYNSNPPLLKAVMEGSGLSIFPSLHKNGTATLRVAATDSQGLTTTSDNFTIEVFHVNHLPTLHNFPKELRSLAKTPTFVDLSQFIDDVEDGQCLKVKTSNSSAAGRNCPPAPAGIVLNFSNPANDVPLTIFIDDWENGHVNASLTLDVKHEDSPIFLATAPLHTPRGVNRTSPDFIADLATTKFVFDRNTPLDNLSFTIVNQSRPDGIDFSLEPIGRPHELNMRVTDPQDRGYAILHIRVSDGKYADDTNLTVILDETVKFIRPLSGDTVDEDTTWRVDLGDHFNRRDVIWGSSDPRVRIDREGNATWVAVHNSTPVADLVFTATDPQDPSNRASSNPITLGFNEINDAPEFYGGLVSADVRSGETWTHDLRRSFRDEEHDSLVTFSVNLDQDIQISGSIATWIPPVGAKNLTGIVFTARDGKDPFPTTDSPPIDLYYIPRNLLPRAMIDSISPSPSYRDQQVKFSGNGTDPDGTVVEFNWSDQSNPAAPAILSRQRDFTARLSPGVHAIALQVRDDRGNWSAFVFANHTVYDANAPLDARKPVWSLVAIGAGLAMLVTGAAMSKIVRRPVGRKPTIARRR
ncbi:MAG TPA: VCBS repeat-containing protein, partial [Thermoplasmata archaeon]|nr:VCBS repeat-containing protein [Thermoplasmata archaeon]